MSTAIGRGTDEEGDYRNDPHLMHRFQLGVLDGPGGGKRRVVSKQVSFVFDQDKCAAKLSEISLQLVFGSYALGVPHARTMA